ncbi:MAG: DEAD/DEAH box helicase [Burkholderiales bacterium]
MTKALSSIKEFTDKEFQDDWIRQRATAAHVVSRFEVGYDAQLIGDEVGMGKTYVALTVVADEILRGGSKASRVLLITPSSAVLREKWEQEVRSFSKKYVKPSTKRQDKPTDHALRPVVINSYWELVAALHDHPDLPRKHVTGERLRCLLEVTWEWFVGRKKLSGSRPTARWTVLANEPPSQIELFNFKAEFSVPAWHTFLEEWNGSRNGELVEALGRKAGMWNVEPARQLERLKGLFREFAEHQDDYEPNVLIVGMRALAKPKSNSVETKLFVTFLLAVLLTGRWVETWKKVLGRLRPTGLLLEGMTLKRLKEEYARIDLFRTRGCCEQVMKDRPLLDEKWQSIVGGETGGAAEFFAALTKAVVSQKLSEANIRLAVVDEVHNWKGGTNGAAEFKAGFAPHIERKLVMSATPFQLDAEELKAVFGAVAKPDGMSAAAVASLYAGEPSIVGRCVTANRQFMQAWEELACNASDLAQVRAAFEGELPAPDTVDGLLADPRATPAMQVFCKAAKSYRVTVEELSKIQQEVVVRHLKRNLRRSFHAGSEFSQPPSRPRTALYETRGLTRPGSELVSFLAMRADQLIRAEASAAESVKAHLVSGMTSSFSAFRAGIHGRSWKAAKLSARTRRYIEMLDMVLETTPHEKVAATVEHALDNYRRGRKTLIFCERRATVDEIQRSLAERMKAEALALNSPDPGLRELVLGTPQFVDLPFARLAFGADHVLADWRLTLIEDTVNMLQAVPVRLDDAAGKRRILRLLNIRALTNARMVAPRVARLCDRAIALFEDPDFAKAVRENLLKAESNQPVPVDLSERVAAVFDEHMSTRNLWLADDDEALAQPLLRLLESEAEHVLPVLNGNVDANVALGFVQRLLDLEAGLKRVVLRKDVLDRSRATREDFQDRVHQAVRAPLGADGKGESSWSRMVRFVSQLADADGSINSDDMTNTRRKGMWRAVSLRAQRLSRHGDDTASVDAADSAFLVADQFVVQSLHGEVDADTRVNRCSAFNSPLPPEVLICTAIGSEGIDLHRECAEVIHHDLPWNPARLEQRNGRVDRVGSLSETTVVDIRIGLPFLEISYEKFQYGTLLRRAQRFELLLGRPDFDLTAGEIERDDEDTIEEPDPDQEALHGVAPPPALPDTLAEWFAVDLAIYPPKFTSVAD